MMIATQSITVKKLKIKIGGKQLEAEPPICKSEQPASLSDRRCDAVNETGRNEGAGKISANGSKLRISLPVSKKRGPPELLDCPKKRLRMDRAVVQQCSAMLKKLMHHQCGWPFNQPVDPVALNIPDYFSIISKPMDLATVKSKLEKNLYLGIEEFAADVRLTFSNAMHYNPPGNDVHIMADQLSKIFESGWKVLEAKWNHGMAKAWFGSSDKQLKSGNYYVGQSDVGMTLPVGSKNRVPNGEAKCKTDAGVIKVKVAKVSQSKPSSISSKELPSERSASLGQEHGSHADGSKVAKSTPASPLGKSDRDSDVCCLMQFKGVGSAADDEGPCTTSGVLAAASDVSYGDGCVAPLSDVQLSPKKALRAAILKSRFAATILKAQHKTLLDHDDESDPIKLQQEKERLEQRQLEEKARIEAQIKAAEARVEAESRKQRERDREAARIALQKMEKTVEIGENLEILKELEILTGGSLSVDVTESDDGSEVLSGGFDGSPGRSALEQLGLFIKDDFLEDDDEETVCNVGEDGEIIS